MNDAQFILAFNKKCNELQYKDFCTLFVFCWALRFQLPEKQIIQNLKEINNDFLKRPAKEGLTFFEIENRLKEFNIFLKGISNGICTKIENPYDFKIIRYSFHIDVIKNNNIIFNPEYQEKKPNCSYMVYKK